MPSRGNYWVKGGLPDKTVTEADLGPTLAEKINEGGGGGATNDTACITDDFMYGSGADLTQFYEVSNGTPQFQQGGLYGVVRLDSGGAGTESAGELTTRNTFEVNPNLGDVSFQVVHIAENTAQMHIISLTVQDFDSVITQAQMEQTADLIGFFCDPDTDNNWRAICRSNDTSSTIVDTGVARTFGERQRFEASFSKTAGEVEFSIENNVVATITTNIPTVPLFMDVYAVNKVSVQRGMEIDYWQVMANRVNE